MPGIHCLPDDVSTINTISESAHEQVQGGAQFGQRITISLPGRSGQHKLYEVVGLNE